ncbi:MAG: metal ABC transporter substrate-binding protein [Bacilli bacterium]|nr:metal ABC transporter substrate-binding protein [Bacilli bacterium]
MKKITKYLLLIISIFTISIFTTGCGNDEMDGTNIAVTNYANEFIVDKLYGKHSKITSIYPDGVDTSTYKLSKKQKQEFSKYGIFVYNGLIESERNIAIDLLNINPNLKIIDTAYILETDYSPEELWLNPASLLMMSQNVKNGLLEYVESTYLQKEITDNYKELKIDISTLDVEYRDAIRDTNDKDVIVDDSALQYLEKLGLNVYCIDDTATDKLLVESEDLITSKKVSYVITFKNHDQSNNSKDMISKHPEIKTLELHKLDVLTDEERDEKKDYLSIMEDNLNLLRQEL